jgi:hypothetical protein
MSRGYCSHRRSVYRRSDSLHNSVETVHSIRGIIHNSDGTVGFGHRVRTLDDVTVAHLVLGLPVPGDTIGDSVVVRVARVGLQSRF